MAVDGFMAFKPYKGDWVASESQSDLSNLDPSTKPLMSAPTSFPIGKGQFFEVDDFSFDVEQTLNIGSQSSGAGAGKVTFNPFSVTRKIDKASPMLYNYACSGTAFETVALMFRKSSGGTASGAPYLRFDFKLVAVKTIAWSHDEESPRETVTFEYGGLQMRYTPQKPDGSMDTLVATGWNRVKNIADTGAAAINA